MSNDLISREALKEDFKSRLALCNEWIEKAKDKETKIRASAVKSFIGEVIMTIDNAPTIKPYCYFCGQAEHGREVERPQGEWITGGKDVTGQYFYDEFICNQCFVVVTDKSNFCPKCGVKMKGGEE